MDRTLGFLFGAARGLLIAVIAFVFFDKLVGEKQHPEWIKQAKLRPSLKETGDQIIALLPDDPEATILNRLKGMVAPAGDAAEPPAAPSTVPPAADPTQPQKRTDTRDLQRLIQTTAAAGQTGSRVPQQGDPSKR
jgi:membrane protein required for colicin V production